MEENPSLHLVRAREMQGAEEKGRGMREGGEWETGEIG